MNGPSWPHGGPVAASPVRFGVVGVLLLVVVLTADVVPARAQAPAVLPWTVDRVASSTGGPVPFGSVPPGGVAFGSDGRVYVLDGQAATVYEFTADLRPIRATGGRGRGPGEFVQPSLLAAGAGGVAVFDPGASRISVFSEGEFAWEAPWDLVDDGIPRRMELLDSDLLIEVEPFPFERGGARSWVGARRLVRLGREGGERVVKRFPALRRSSQPANGDQRPVVFAPELHWAVRPTGDVLVSTSDRYRIESFDPDTRAVGSFAAREVGPARPVTEEIRAQVRSQTLQRFAENRGQSPLSRVDGQVMRQSIAEMQFADSLPVTGDLIGGLDGLVLVERGIGLADARASTPPDALAMSPDWDVFREDGTYLGVLEFPPGFQPRDAFRDVVVGVRVGEFGEVVVEVWRISSPTGVPADNLDLP